LFSISSVLLAVAISFDSFFAGISYGCARIKVPVRSLVTAGAVTGFAMLLSMSFGAGLTGIFGSSFARWLGGALLVVLGASALNGANGASVRTLPVVRLSFLGLIVHIIREPRTADFDRSSVIDAREALVLGTALAMDAFGVGIGAALAGYQVLGMTILSGLACPLSLAGGVMLGSLPRLSNPARFKKVPPWVLIAIGLFRFM
jgi:putative sporulation protein YtaF